MYKIILSLIISATFAMATESMVAKGCKLSQDGSLKVSWKAFKTPAKIGVGGSFDSLKYTPAKKEGSALKDILVGSKVLIDTASVNSNNKGRDAKLVKFFFEQMQGKEIEANIVDLKTDANKNGTESGTITIEVAMNNLKKKVPMHFSLKDGMLNASGVIDLFDFNGSSALKSINKACFAKHQGKTWNDVDIGFSTAIKKVCQ